LSFNLFGCDELPCISKQSVQFGLAFYFDSVVKDVKRPFPFNSIVIKNETGKIILDSNKTLIGLKPPLDAIKFDIPLNSKYLILSFLDTNAKDSIQVNLVSSPSFISQECGYKYFYNISSVQPFGGKKFKKFEIVYNRIDTAAKNHVQIFF